MVEIMKLAKGVKSILNTYAHKKSCFSIKEDTIDICLFIKDTQEFWETGARISAKLTMHEIFTRHHSILIHNEDNTMQIPIQKHTFKIFFCMDNEFQGVAK